MINSAMFFKYNIIIPSGCYMDNVVEIGFPAVLKCRPGLLLNYQLLMALQQARPFRSPPFASGARRPEVKAIANSTIGETYRSASVCSDGKIYYWPSSER